MNPPCQSDHPEHRSHPDPDRLASLRDEIAHRLSSASPQEVIEELISRQVALEQENAQLRRLSPGSTTASRNEPFQHLLAVAPEPVFLISVEGEAKGRILDVNEAAVLDSGYSREQLLAMHVWDLDTPESAHLAEERMKRLNAQGAIRFKVEHRRPDGSIFPVEVSACLAAVEGRRCAIAFHRDLSERTTVQERLRLFESCLSRLNDIVMITEGEPVEGEGPRVVYVNDAFTRRTGFSREEILGKSPRILQGPKTDRTVLDRIHAALKAWEPCRVELINYTKTGEEFWLELDIVPVGNEKGHYTHWAAVERDITEQKRMQALESDQRVRLELAAKAGDIGFWDWDLLTNEVFYSAQWKRQLGYEDHEIRHRYEEWEARLHPEDHDRVIQAAINYTQGKATEYETEFRMRHKDGGYRWIFARGDIQLLPDGRPQRMLGCHVDVTLRKVSELALRASRELLDRALEAIAEGIVVQDHRGTILYSNTTACRILGLTPDQMSGRTSVDPRWAAIHEDGSPFPGETHPSMVTLRTGKPLRNVIMGVRRPDNELAWVSINSVPLEFAFEGHHGVVCSFVDVTARKSAEVEREALESQLLQAQKMDAIGTLAGGIAHDFNNILGAILGNLELARLEASEGTALDECLVEISKAGHRARSLVRQILAFSRQQPAERKVILLGPVVEEVARFMRATISTMVSIDCEIAPGVSPVVADPSQMHQILVNLCTNAWHSMEGRSGRIVMRLHQAELEASLAARIEGIKPGPYVIVEVNDNGSGMDEASLGRIFEPFFTTKGVGQGTGLGLSVVHGIVRNHQGGIQVVSKVGEGSTFRIYLPACSNQPCATTAAEPLALGKGQHILYIDDELPLSRVMTHSLERLGYRVTSFSKPELAVEEFSKDSKPFDLVITDFEMPGMTGLDVSRQLLRVRPGIPILLLSGFLKDSVHRQAAQLGIRQVLMKPCDMTVLSQLLSSIFAPVSPRLGSSPSSDPRARY